MLDVLVMGAGGVGGYYGGLLGRGGHRLSLVARGPHLHALQANGLRVETAEEGEFTVPVDARAAAEPGRYADLVIVAVKSYDLEEAIACIDPAVGMRTTVLTLLNGVESGERLAQAFGPERVLDGLVYIESYIKQPGVIFQAGGSRRVVFGNRNGPNAERERNLLATFAAAGWKVDLADNVVGALWTKFAYLGPYAAFNTVTGLNSGKVCEVEEAKALMRQMVSEYVAVGNAEGARLDQTVVDGIMDSFQNAMVGMTSMLRDRVGGRRIESDALVSSVVRRGARAGVPTPVTKILATLLKPMEAGGTPPPTRGHG
jgi:2-dehydropantoate 2-reductase